MRRCLHRAARATGVASFVTTLVRLDPTLASALTSKSTVEAGQARNLAPLRGPTNGQVRKRGAKLGSEMRLTQWQRRQQQSQLGSHEPRAVGEPDHGWIDEVGGRIGQHHG
jgi:hypothetical protein